MPNNEYKIGSQHKTEHKGPGIGGGPGMSVGSGEKAKNFGKTWGKLSAYCKPYLPAIIVALLLACVGSVFNIIGPSKLSEITDLITAGMGGGAIDLGAITGVGLTLVALYLMGYAFNYIQGFIMATMTQKVSKRLRTDISKKINRVPLSYFDKTSYGDVLSRVTNDVDTIGQTLNQSIGMLVTSITMFVGSFIMMLTINVLMTVAAVVAVVIGFVLMLVIISHSQKHFNRQQKALGKMNGHVEEVYAGHSVVKAYNGEKDEKKTFDQINKDLYQSAWKSQFMSGMMMPIMTFIGNLGYVAVCVVGAILAINGSITFGVIVAFMVYIRLFTQPLSQIAQAATTLQSTAAAGERVFEFLEERELEDESGKTQVLKNIEGNVTFKNVQFGYTKNKTIIKNFSVDVKAGQKVAIVGPTGAGKTTMVNLLMRFYEIGDGQIKVDGVPIDSLTRENVHDMFCMVLQDTWLFEGTIKENIIYNKEGVTDEQVVNACKAAGVHKFITSLPHGYDTILNDKANLSAGQKQLITIARAMVDDAPMLILDEATSSVDTRTEIMIQRAMDKLMDGRTTFVIAHRLSTIKNSNLILTMCDGDIVEAGTHEELLALDGVYAELYNSQFENNAA
ncbi:MAG: ABC transporter ATP-binding protein [Christensenella hongkongensis]|uniref:ABC transporter ATP-binding protein n=1 Tax=Christensenella hongkongensis TaxID=270498 RepID=UPI002A764AA1|nr:ABC transporter ATP-binding protein [Christensenella hongkongensis]MDY3004528.1 ABC transporter ATP-binding protein [Christensenella hongkongensis]